jgi:hypothetical protein
MMPQADAIESLDTYFCPYCRQEHFADYYPDGKHWVTCCNCGEEFYMYKETSCTFRTEKIFV